MKSETLVWVAIIALVLWYILGQAKKTASSVTKRAAQAGGYGLGQGLVDEGVHALGSFVSGLFGNKSSSGAAGAFTSSAPAHTVSDDDLLEPDFGDDDLEI